jgi:hypothetical protein
MNVIDTFTSSGDKQQQQQKAAKHDESPATTTTAMPSTFPRPASSTMVHAILWNQSKIIPSG